MQGAVIGNGPSRKYFEDDSFENIIGCNIPNDDIVMDSTVISDTEIVWILKNSPELIQIPIIISTKVFEKLKEFKLDKHYQILSVFKPMEGFNSAHYATLKLIDYGCTDIHIWGCDSIFSDVKETTTSAFIETDHESIEKLYRTWRKTWEKITKAHPDINFVYHYGTN